MAFFKFRKGGDAAPAATAQPESVEALRRRARHRLIGAAVLVLVGVIGFPLLFDTQPRPIAVDIPIEIPDRAKAHALPAPPPSRTQGPVTDQASGKQAAASATPAATAPVVAAGSAPRPAASVVPAAPVAIAKDTPASRVEPVKPAPVQQAKAESTSKPEQVRPATAKAPDGTRAQALLDGKAEKSGRSDKGAATQAEGRFIVQVGAFADVTKAREARLKVERAGLKTYTQVADTGNGRRIRVRVGPFANRAEADKAAGRIKDLDLPAAILTL